MENSIYITFKRVNKDHMVIVKNGNLESMEDICKKYYPDIPIEYKYPLEFPYIINHDFEYLRAIHGEFYCYVTCLEGGLDFLKKKYPKEIDETFINKIRSRTNLAGKKILKAYDLSLNSNLEEAIEEIMSLLNDFKNAYIHPLGKSYGIKCLNIYIHPDAKVKKVYFFRGRSIQKTCLRVNKKELFHIPFNRREIIQTERFSVAGTPCLYFGDNTYISQNEIRTNKTQNAFYSVFKPNQNFLSQNIIDLSMPDLLTDAIYGSFPTAEGERVLSIGDIKTLLMDSPSHLLNIACRIQCDQENRSFKSEYVIPQLIMYCLQKLNCVGVAYESTCSGNHHILQTCFAFPAFKKERKNSLYSKELLNSFTISDGFNYSQFLSKRYDEHSPKEGNPFKTDYYKIAKGYFARLYRGHRWAFYDGNLPYYKSDNYAFDQYLIEQLGEQK